MTSETLQKQYEQLRREDMMCDVLEDIKAELESKGLWPRDEAQEN